MELKGVSACSLAHCTFLVASMLLICTGRAQECCPSLWTSFDGQCYRYFGNPTSWSEAEAHCISASSTVGKEGHLVSIHSNNKNAFVYQLWQSSITPSSENTEEVNKWNSLWIGFKNLSRGFEWSDGSESSYTFWSENGLTTNRMACVHTGNESRWNVVQCTTTLPFVCKLDPNSPVNQTIQTLHTLEDFNASHSYSLKNQFGHEKSFGSGFLEGAQSLTINPTNENVVVADWYSTDVKIYNSSGHLIGKLDTSLGKQTSKSAHPRDVAVSSNGTFFVTHQCPYVKVFNASGHFVQDLESSHVAAENARLSGIAFTKDGRLVIGECRFNSISIHLQDGTRLNTFNIELTPRYLAVTPNDTIVVSSWEPMAVHVMSLTGDVLHTLFPPSDITEWRPTGVCCSDEMIFVANDPETTKDASIHDDHGIFCYSFSGKYLGSATKNVFNPTGVAVTSSGNKLVVAHWERGNTLQGRGLHGVKVFAKNERNETNFA